MIYQNKLDYGMCIDIWLLLESYAGNLHTYFVYWMKYKTLMGDCLGTYK